MWGQDDVLYGELTEAGSPLCECENKEKLELKDGKELCDDVEVRGR